ncbi:hypothetical protein PMAYCL1PPCAC_02065, partial [Pristionchus mayeri]
QRFKISENEKGASRERGTMDESSSKKKDSFGKTGFPSRTPLPPSPLVHPPFAVPPRKNGSPSVSPALPPPQPHTVSPPESIIHHSSNHKLSPPVFTHSSTTVHPHSPSFTVPTPLSTPIPSTTPCSTPISPSKFPHTQSSTVASPILPTVLSHTPMPSSSTIPVLNTSSSPTPVALIPDPAPTLIPPAPTPPPNVSSSPPAPPPPTVSPSEMVVAPSVPPRFPGIKKKKSMVMERIIPQQSTALSLPSSSNEDIILNAVKVSMNLPRLFVHNVDKKHHELSILEDYFNKYDGLEAITISSSPHNPFRSGMLRYTTIHDAERVLNDGPVHTINGHDLFLTPREGRDEKEMMEALTSSALKRKEEEEAKEKKRREEQERRDREERRKRHNEERPRHKSEKRSRSRSRERRRKSRSRSRERRRHRSGSREGRRHRSRSRERRHRSRSEEGGRGG